MEFKKKVVIDCDPGIDDCFALLLCICHLDVQGIVAVGGNTGLRYTERNARYITELTGRTDIPVYAGYDMPMLNKIVRATEIHGSGGIGTVVIGEPKKHLEKQHGVDFLIDTFMNHDDISLITLGPLTNVAQALLKEPRLKERIPEILCMGGSAFCGNATPTAEFNILVDPEAAKIVFESGIPIQMVGLNLTRQNLMCAADVERLKEIGGPVGSFAAELLGFSVGNSMTPNLCDAAAVSWWTGSGVITKSMKVHVDVETKGEFTRGMTVCDWRNYMGSDPLQEISREKCDNRAELPKNVEVAMEFDREQFRKLLFETIEWYKEQ
ncbi:MAG: nucleoside hydrolase [Lachnospiraceae bacterium]|nr:nucleoside hydrolase [Lachnospiraceae bacterium]